MDMNIFDLNWPSATTFLEKCRKVVLKIWFEKSGSRKMVLQTFFSGLRKVVDQKKRWFYTENKPFFRLEKSGSAKSDFFLVREKWLTRKKGGFIQ